MKEQDDLYKMYPEIDWVALTVGLISVAIWFAFVYVHNF